MGTIQDTGVTISIRKKQYVIVKHTNKDDLRFGKIYLSDDDTGAVDELNGTKEVPGVYDIKFVKKMSDKVYDIIIVANEEGDPEISYTDPVALCFGHCPEYVIVCDNDESYCNNDNKLDCKASTDTSDTD